MEIIIHIDKKKIDKNYQEAINEYFKRLMPFCRMSAKTYKTVENMTFNKSSYKYFVVPSKNTISSLELAATITTKNIEGYSSLEFIILDYDGSCVEQVTEKLKEKIQNCKSDFSISSFTFSCDLTAVALSEQIYRAYTINNNITYHK